MPFAFEWISGGRLRRSRLRYRYEAEALNINLTRGPVLNIREVYLNVWNERKKKKPWNSEVVVWSWHWGRIGLEQRVEITGVPRRNGDIKITQR